MKLYQLIFYVPEPQLESVKEAIFVAGAGQYDLYSHCCWQSLGQGQFKPLQGSDPHLGEQGEVCTVAEYKVETICQEDRLNGVLAALLSSHPYETPAYSVFELHNSA